MDAATQLNLWRLRRSVRSMGWPAIGGIALALFAGGLFVSGVMPLQAQVAQLREQVRQLEARPASQHRHVVEHDNPDARLGAFYGELAHTRQAPDIVRRLHGYARAVGLVLERGEYRPLPHPSGKMVRYQIVLPVRGDYPRVKDFLARAMRGIPGLALEAVGFQRDDDSRALEAQLRFTVFLRAEA